MTRARLGVLLFPLMGYTIVSARAPATPAPAFEVASVKQNLSGRVGGSIEVPPAGAVRFTNVTLRMMFDLATPIWAEGAVVRFDRINPHSIITLEEKTKDGQVRRWAVEGPDAGRLDRSGIARDFLKTGDVVRFCTFPMKEEFLSKRLSLGADGVPQRWVHGHVLIRNGQKSMWGSYGTFSACIRSSDEPRESWLAFLNSDPRVQWIWCDQRGRKANQETASSPAYVEEITRLMKVPCA